MRTTELKRRMSTMLDKCTLLTYNNNYDYFIHCKTTGSIGGNINKNNNKNNIKLEQHTFITITIS